MFWAFEDFIEVNLCYLSRFCKDQQLRIKLFCPETLSLARQFTFCCEGALNPRTQSARGLIVMCYLQCAFLAAKLCRTIVLENVEVLEATKHVVVYTECPPGYTVS